MNIKLLREISDVIQRKPSKFAMRFLHQGADGEATTLECGTAHCICGWAQILGHPRAQNGPDGENAFGVDRYQLQRLIFISGWPKEFSVRYELLKTNRAKARCAAQRIEHFIATDGAE